MGIIKVQGITVLALNVLAKRPLPAFLSLFERKQVTKGVTKIRSNKKTARGRFFYYYTLRDGKLPFGKRVVIGVL